MGALTVLRLGLVQSAIGSVMVLMTAILNRVMVVEMQMAASLPAALVAWHYAVQIARPAWGHGSDRGANRTRWIVGGMGCLALGGLIATNATLMMARAPVAGTILGILGYGLIGAGVGASGTSLLALLTAQIAPERRPAAAATTWVMMIAGIVITAGVTSQLLDPYSPQRLALVSAGVVGVAILLTLIAVYRVETRGAAPPAAQGTSSSLRDALARIWREPLARNFTLFVFVSMLAFSAQELILEPYAGLVFDYTIGKSTALAGLQHGGVLAGMIVVGLAGTLVSGDRTPWLMRVTCFGCLASAATLAVLGWAGLTGTAAVLKPVVFGLGFANGVFSVSAVGLMMATAGAGGRSREGVRMGVWGAAQAVAFALGGFLGAAGLDAMRHLLASTPLAFMVVFGVEAAVFVVAAGIALRLDATQAHGGALLHPREAAGEA